jgi:biopolymer transport protein ExbB
MLELARYGGPVFWICVACGVAALVVFVERALHLHRARIKSDDFVKGILTILGRNNIPEALTICDETPGPVAYIVRTAILHRQAQREAMGDAVRDAGLAEVSRMERRLVVIATIAQLAPLLGLLGTVLGMIDVAMVLAQQSPLVQAAHLHRGMMKALVNTAAGLMVAIPAHAAFNLLVVKIDRIVLDMERAGAEIVAFLAGSAGPGDGGGKA